MNVKKYIVQYFILLITFICLMVSANIAWNEKQYNSILEADAKGYYAYLPAIFIYQDLHFGFFEKIENEQYANPQTYFDYRVIYKDQYINKYYPGTAFAVMPFFLVAHVLANLMGYLADGYSIPYIIAVNIAALFYLLIGLYYLHRIFSVFNISVFHQIFTLLAITFGSNLFYYAAIEPGMSHIFSFAFCAMLIYYSLRYFNIPNSIDLIYISASLGMILLIRPVNGLIILIFPFVAGSINTLKNGLLFIFKHYKHFLFAFTPLLFFISIQLILNKVAISNFLVYAYGKEGFNFSNPHIFSILFSYRKGLFVYTPLYLFALLGVFVFWKNNWFRFSSWLAAFFIITYVLSSWWLWYYGGSFSGRVFVEYLPMFAILLALTFKTIKQPIFKKVFATCLFLLVVLCQIQTYQYRYYQIHWCDMTKEKYWDVFLRIDKIK